jgi:copper homeostasis protein
MKLLEVIVTCLEEAKQAEQGGANRLEVVRDLQHEGLTPAYGLVEAILNAVSVPIRIMLRETPNFFINSVDELALLKATAAQLAQLPIGGFVLGFLNGSSLDISGLETVLQEAGSHPITFHRAFEQVSDQTAAIEQLKRHPKIDRILVNGGLGSWGEKRSALDRLQTIASPEITIMAGGGLTESALRALSESPHLNEFHVGKAARDADGTVVSARVASLRQLLDAQ